MTTTEPLEAAPETDRYRWIALSNTTLGVFMASLDSSIVLISLPAIFRGIHLDPLQPGNVSYLLWMLMGYLVVTAVLVVTFGRLGDMYGRVRMYNAGLRGLQRRVARAVAHAVDRVAGRDVADRLARRAGRRRRAADRELGRDPHRRVPGDPARLRDRRQRDRRHGRRVHRPRRRRAARRHRLARWCSGSTCRSACSGRCGPTSSCARSASRRRRASTGGATSPSASGSSWCSSALTYGLLPHGGHTMGWTGPWVLFELIGGAALLVAVRVDRDPGRRPDVPPRPVPHPRVPDGQRRRLPVVDRARRPAVRAHHLAAGHLAAAARLQLRAHAAVGRHLHAAADAAASCSPARSRAGCPTATARARSRTGGMVVAAASASGCSCSCPPNFAFPVFARAAADERHRHGPVRRTEHDRHHEQRARPRTRRGVGHAGDVPEQRAWCCRSASSSR